MEALDKRRRSTDGTRKVKRLVAGVRVNRGAFLPIRGAGNANHHASTIRTKTDNGLTYPSGIPRKDLVRAKICALPSA